MNLINFTELVLEKVKMNLRSEVRKSYLSYAWWVLEPALMVSVFYLIFGVLLRRGGQDFLAFLLCGYIPFQWFSRSVQNSMVSITNGSGLINQIQIPKAFFPMVTILHDFFKALVIFVLLLFVLLIYGVKPSVYWLYIIPIIFVQLIFVTACGVFASMVLPFAQDLRFLIGTGITMLMFGSGIFYDYKRTILPEHQSYFLFNPMANLLSNYREVLLYSGAPDWLALGVITLFSCMVLLLLINVLWRMDGVYPRLVLE
jgi:lipopolysaccharide transport system permease protein